MGHAGVENVVNFAHHIGGKVVVVRLGLTTPVCAMCGACFGAWVATARASRRAPPVVVAVGVLSAILSGGIYDMTWLLLRAATQSGAGKAVGLDQLSLVLAGVAAFVLTVAASILGAVILRHHKVTDQDLECR